MEQKHVSWVIYGVLLAACVFAIGYLFGKNGKASQVTITTVPRQAVSVVEQAPPAGKIDLNEADAYLLQSLPGIGSELAQRIVDYRASVGEFLSIEQIMDVEGIGNKRFEEMKEFICVGGVP